MGIAGQGRKAIQCRYSCAQCGLKRQVVTVKARTDEDIMTWMDQILTPALSADHDRRSPGCHITKLTEVMIPVAANNPNVGGVD